MKFQKAKVASLVALAAVFLLECQPAGGQSVRAGSAPLSESARKGKQIFQDACFLCHDVDSERVRPLGPSLNGLFQRRTLLTGQPVTAENVKEVIRIGPTPGMPGFRYTLSDGELNDLMEFLKTK